MMERKGLAVLRRNMKVFIEADYRDIWLERPTKTPTSNGSWIEGLPDPLAPQMFRLIPAKRRHSNPEVDSQDGNIPFQDWTMIGEYDADVQRDDEFTLNGDRYKVTAVTPDTAEREFTDRVVVQLELRGEKVV
jgi:hypothetical protein